MASQPAVRVSSSGLTRQLRKAAANAVARRLPVVLASVEEECNRIVKRLYVTDRPPERRRHGQHLLNSFVAEAKSTADFPMEITVRSTAPKVKVNSLNFGRKAYTMPGKPLLSFPTPAGGRKRAGQVVAAYGTQRPGTRERKSKAQFRNGVANTVTSVVNVKARPGDHFLEKGLEAAIRKEFNQSAKASRS